MSALLQAAALVLLMLWGLPGSSWAQVQHLDSARATVSVGANATRADVPLPYHWDRRNRGQSGTAEFELQFDLNGRPDILYGLYFRRLGNAYEIWLNDRLLQRNGDMGRADSADFAKAPRYVAIPRDLVRDTNVLRIRIRADGGRRGGVARPVFGPEVEVRAMFEHEQRWRIEGSFAVVVLSLLVGSGALLLWFTQVDASQPRGKGRDALYLFAGVAEICWALRVADAIIERPPVSWTWWGTLQAAAIAIWLSSMAVVCMKLSGWDKAVHGRLLLRFLLGFVLAGCMASFASFQFDRTWVLTAWYAAAALFFLCFGSAFVVSAVRSANTLHRLVAIALTANVAMGIRDAIVFRLSDSYGDNSYLRYTSVLFGLVLGYVLLVRFQAATTQARESMRNLEQTISRREAELESSYQRLEVLAREQERALERARILRDMHDGVGSHITSAIRQLQSARSTRAEVLDTLRDSLDHLKLSIDAMHLPPGDVAALLANLRYRFDPRFAASDIELRWEVQVIASAPVLAPAAMRHLQFILFEALSNVLQHARASVLCIEGLQQAGDIVIRLTDNGVGFDTTLPPRKGLLSMHERAEAVGARLSVTSQAAGTTVEVLIPV